uniref:Choice-of-anchor D domain-containing protein n=1 Tax=uncultured Bdellovibrionales bacterium TaxID=395355 RepID=A0A977T7A7_9BACT|nr:choice-of-anchor D domain-containing protein [uncultured Bdellovibrionales bacterium]
MDYEGGSSLKWKSKEGIPMIYLARLLTWLICSTLFIFQLTGCSGGGSGGNPTLNQGKEKVSIRGVAQAGPINGSVNIYEMGPNGERGKFLGAQNTDNGVFEIDIQKTENPVIIEADGTYVDETTGLKVNMQGHVLKQILPNATENTDAPVTPVTTFVADMVQEKIEKGLLLRMDVERDIKESNQKVAQLFGVDLDTIKAVPKPPTQMDSQSKEGKAAFLLTAISQAMKDGGLTPDQGVNPVEALKKLSSALAQKKEDEQRMSGSDFVSDPKLQNFVIKWATKLKEAREKVAVDKGITLPANWAPPRADVGKDSVNYAPEAMSDFIKIVDEAPEKGLTASDRNGDVLTFKIVIPPSKGVVEFTNQNTGTFRYIPTSNQFGSDSFTFKVSDGLLESRVFTVQLNRVPENGVFNNECYFKGIVVSQLLNGKGLCIGDGFYYISNQPHPGLDRTGTGLSGSKFYSNGNLANGYLGGKVYKDGEFLNGINPADNRFYIAGEIGNGEINGIVYDSGLPANGYVDGALVISGVKQDIPQTGFYTAYLPATNMYINFNDGILANGVIDGKCFSKGYKTSGFVDGKLCYDGVLKSGCFFGGGGVGSGVGGFSPNFKLNKAYCYKDGLPVNGICGTFRASENKLYCINGEPVEGFFDGKCFKFDAHYFPKSGWIDDKYCLAGESAPYLSFRPQPESEFESTSSLEFDKRAVGTSETARFTVTNFGAVTALSLAVSMTNEENNPFTISENTCITSLEAKSTCTISVRFEPKSAGNFRAELSLAYKFGTFDLNRTLVLMGQGFEPGNLAFDGTSRVDFPNTAVGAQVPNRVIVIKNVGSEKVWNLKVLKTRAPFEIGASTCPTDLAGKATCTVTIHFSPHSVGPQMGNLKVEYSSAQGPGRVSMDLQGLSLPRNNSVCGRLGDICDDIVQPVDSNFVCGNPGNGCYDNKAAMEHGQAKLPDETPIVLVTNKNGFKVWKELSGERIIHASGLWKSNVYGGGWQMKLNPNGKGFSDEYFIDIDQLSGRACAPNGTLPSVFIDDTTPDLKFAPGFCLYYDGGTLAALGKKQCMANWELPDCKMRNDRLVPQGIFGIDFLGWWRPLEIRLLATPVGGGKWYVGNVLTCRLKGMRLPTFFEIDNRVNDINFPLKDFPLEDGNPSPNLPFPKPAFADTHGVPPVPVGDQVAGSYLSFTATSFNSPANTDPGGSSYWTYPSSYGGRGFSEYLAIRCVLP